MEQRNRTRIPKFGSWDSSDATTPFTELFEEARAARGGTGSGSSEAEILAGRVRNGHPYKVNPTKHVRRASKEEGEEVKTAAGLPPAQRRQIEPPAYRVIDDSRYVPQGSGENVPPRIVHSQSAHESGSVGRVYSESLNAQSNSRSPARGNGNRSNASPTWEKVPRPASASEGSSTPGRSRLRNSNTSSEPAEKAPALPKFGAWDATDPASADGFTVIFNNARNEKKTGGSIHVPPIGLVDKDLYPQRDATETKSSTRKFFCCFQPSQGVEA